METQTDFTRLFTAIDKSDTSTFLSYLTEDAIFRFANLPQVKGQTAIGEFLTGFFASIDHTKHSDIQVYPAGDHIFSTGKVTYTRLDGSTLSVPFCNEFIMKGDKIDKYHIFVDNSELYKQQ